MKSIKQQYIDLKEGRMNQAQFMRNVRMSLPHLVTNVTSFNDTVKILKNKAILTEVDIKGKTVKTYTQNGDKSYNVTYDDGTTDRIAVSNDAWDDINILHKNATNLDEIDIYGIAGNPEAEAEMRAGGQSIKPKQTPEEKYGVDQKIDQSELNFLKKIYAKTPTDKIKQMIDDLENRMKLKEAYDDPQSAYILNSIKGETKDTIKKVVGVDNSGIYSKDVNWFSENGYTKMTFDTVDDLFATIPNVGRVFSGGSIENQKSMAGTYKRHMGTNPFVVWVKRNSLSESYTTNTSGKELYSKFAEIDNLNGQEVLIGIDYEIEKNSDLTKKEAAKIVVKNLKKNPFYYTDSLMAGKEGAEAEYMNKLKPGSDQMKDVKGGDLVDKTNGMTSPKNIEKAKASSNKANKETNKPEAGIKLMSLVAKTVRGVKKMDPTGEKMKKLALKENINENLGDIAEEVYNKLLTMDTHDSADRAKIIATYNLSPEDAKEVEVMLFDMMADERYDDGSSMDDMLEYSTLPGGDNMTDVAGHQMDEAKAGSLSVGDKFKIAANLGKFVKDEEVEVVSLEPFGNDIKLVLSNGKDKDDFYLDRNDEI